MRASEILNEKDFPEIERKSKWATPSFYKKDLPGKKQLGSGGFATAYADDDNPHEVTKGSAAMLVKDGYTAFLDALSKSFLEGLMGLCINLLKIEKPSPFDNFSFSFSAKS